MGDLAPTIFDAAASQVQADLNDNGRFDTGDLEINGITAIAPPDIIVIRVG